MELGGYCVVVPIFIPYFNFIIYCSLGNSDTQAPGLSELAQFVLREICSQEWVLERCLQNPEELCHQDMLLDSMLSSKQV